MNDDTAIQAAIAKGLEFMTDQQLSQGGFSSVSRSGAAKSQPGLSHQTVFVPALILKCLSGLGQPAAQQINNRLASFLLHQRSPDWTFNYWVKGTSERQSSPTPNDLDTTFCSLIGLHSYNPKLISSRTQAQLVRLLLSCENRVGGPYHSWVVTSQTNPVWRQVDLAVNCNIAYFLQKIDVRLPRLEALFEQRIASHNFNSSYYPNDSACLYYLARSYQGPLTKQLQQIIMQRWQPQSPALQTALYLTALARTGLESNLLPIMARQLRAEQAADGSWPNQPFCFDATPDSQQLKGGAASLTTAFAIEALDSYSRLASNLRITTATKPQAVTPDHKVIQKHIQITARRQFDQFSEPLQRPANQLIDRLLRSSAGDEITLLPFRFAQAWQGARQDCSTDNFAQLGVANLLGRMAYTCYDDFMDDDGQPPLLPVANVCLRGSLQYFKSCFKHNPAFLTYIDQVFDRIDEANSWELDNCRFEIQDQTIWLDKLPLFDDRMVLAERSLGHALGPIASAVLLGESLASPRLANIELGLRHYLIARQLQDDLHDWQADIMCGHISYVTSEILRELGSNGPQSVEKLLVTMRRQFWHHSLSNICDVIDYHLRQAQSLLSRSRRLSPTNALTKLLDNLQQTVNKTRQSQAEAKGFLDGYNTYTAPQILTLP